MSGVIDADETTLRTDGLPSYLRFGSMGIRHDRQIEGHRNRATEILPWVHVMFTNLEAWLPGTFRGVSQKHMARYLDEFAYRFNRRWREEELLGFVLGRAALGEPLSYHQLIAESVG